MNMNFVEDLFNMGMFYNLKLSFNMGIFSDLKLSFNMGMFSDS